MDALFEPLTFQFFQRALLASVLAGTVCAVVGSYVVLKGLAFIGDAIAHAAFPGVVVAYMVGAPYAIGGGIAAFLTAITHRLDQPSAASCALTRPSASFSPGRSRSASSCTARSTASSATYSASSSATSLAIGTDDLIGLIVLGAIVLGTVAVLWKELLYSTFDPLGAAASGLPVNALEYLFLGLVAMTIVISLQAVGIILVVAMLVTPAATAQLLTVRFSRMIVLATLVGALTVDSRALPELLVRRSQWRHDRARPDRHVSWSLLCATRSASGFRRRNATDTLAALTTE